MTQRVSVPASTVPTEELKLPTDQTHEPMTSDLGLGPAQQFGPHEIERAVMHRLQNHPSLKFSRLNVHQCGLDTICLDGLLESNAGDIDLCELVRSIHDFKEVINHVVSPGSPASAPKKG